MSFLGIQNSEGSRLPLQSIARLTMPAADEGSTDRQTADRHEAVALGVERTALNGAKVYASASAPFSPCGRALGARPAMSTPEPSLRSGCIRSTRIDTLNVRQTYSADGPIRSPKWPPEQPVMLRFQGRNPLFWLWRTDRRSHRERLTTVIRLSVRAYR